MFFPSGPLNTETVYCYKEYSDEIFIVQRECNLGSNGQNENFVLVYA
jgi:hypothetical protein